MCLNTSYNGTSLRDIIAALGNKEYYRIHFRCKWTENGEPMDEWFGACQYKNGRLRPLDGDVYSLDEAFSEWKEEIIDGKQILTVWEHAALSEQDNQLIWSVVKGALTPGGDPCWICPKCQAPQSKHIYGIESNTPKHVCPICHTILRYPWE